MSQRCRVFICATIICVWSNYVDLLMGVFGLCANFTVSNQVKENWTRPDYFQGGKLFYLKENVVFLLFQNVSCFFQMVLVAIFSETGFFDYCAVKVSL